ncbi:hypothetical protein GGR53DRAFT_526766 [Hypoxylon sp. FL1150]|nr:hypothetical protein GGR53DRAFT_526766 [Hypoxylon sp. FL1150]
MSPLRACPSATLSVLIPCAYTLIQAAIAGAVSIPRPSGPYHVSVSTHTIEHYNPNDPLAGIGTEPAGEPQPYLNPETAAFFESSWNYTAGVLASITSSLQHNAPFLKGPVGESPYPTILFGPGGVGPPVEGSTILLAELASCGYTVIGLDHPFEQPFLQYPNGTGVYGVDVDYSDSPLIEEIYETRLVDNTAFLNNFTEFVQKLDAPINTTHIGALGCSLGGAAALGSMYDYDSLVSGLNFDGSLYAMENSSFADEKEPVLMLGNQYYHTGGEVTDITWNNFLAHQTGYVRELSVNGTTHHDFCDDTFWKMIEPGRDQLAGPIDGYRQIDISNTYVKAFFDFTLLGQNSPLLDGPSPDWPEVAFSTMLGSV